MNPTGDNTTGDPTLVPNNVVPAVVSPAQVPATPQYAPVPAPVTDDTAERRIRDLMSAKDKANADAFRAQQMALKAQQDYEELKRATSDQIQGAVTATQALMDAKANLETQRQMLEAENMKLKLLAQHPDLLPYAEFIPAAADEAGIKANIERFQAARQTDKSRQPATTLPVQTDVPSMRSIYPPNAMIPAMQPAAAPLTNPEASLEDFQTRVKALDNLNPTERAQKFGELIKEAEVLARRQFNVQ